MKIRERLVFNLCTNLGDLIGALKCVLMEVVGGKVLGLLPASVGRYQGCTKQEVYTMNLERLKGLPPSQKNFIC